MDKLDNQKNKKTKFPNIKNIKEKRKTRSDEKTPKIVIQGSYTRVKLTSSILKLSSIYKINKVWVKILIIIIVSIFSGIIGDLLLQNTGLYMVGIEAIAQGLARIISFFATENKEVILNALFWILIIVVNIPILIFGWFKVGKQFTLYSAFYVVVSSLFGLGFGFINNIDQFFILANTTDSGFYEVTDHVVRITTWDSTEDASAQLSLFIYAFVYGIIQAILYSVLFILDCSSAGLDIFVVWYAEKKYKDIGTIFTYCNVLCFIISYIIGTYIPASETLETTSNPAVYELVGTPWDYKLLFSPNFVATLMMSIVLGMTLNRFFPKYQMTRVEVVSRKVEEIRDELISSEKSYSLSINTVEGGYSKLPQKVLITNCMYIDTPNLLKIVRKYDSNALFSLILIKNIDGFIYVSGKEENFSLRKKILLLFKKSKKETGQIMNEEGEIEFEVDKQLVTNKDIDKLVDNNLLKKESDSKITSDKNLKVIEASEVYDKKLENQMNQDDDGKNDD